jgi:chloramphenicol 3-O phosphotransferase
MSEAAGRIVLLVGPSCVGKSTLTSALQDAASSPLLALSLDGLFAGVPDRWGGQGDLRAQGFHYRWLRGSPGEPGAVRCVGYGAVGWRMLQGLHRAAAAYAACGVDVVVDDMLLDAAVLADWGKALAGAPTLLVRLRAPLAELQRREQARRLHPTPGLAEGHFALHEGVAADLVIDTAATPPETAARLIHETSFQAAGSGALHAVAR